VQQLDGVEAGWPGRGPLLSGLEVVDKVHGLDSSGFCEERG
jgi:hypothetical protein